MNFLLKRTLPKAQYELQIKKSVNENQAGSQRNREMKRKIEGPIIRLFILAPLTAKLEQFPHYYIL